MMMLVSSNHGYLSYERNTMMPPRAYRIYTGNQLEENSSDAGEPSGTAGLPILNA